VAEGQSRLRPGARVRALGIAPMLEGVYVLTAVDHICDGVKGYVSVISTAPLPPRLNKRSATAAFGIVTHVNDPEGFGRVQVKLPTFNNVETDWMSVLLAGAGAGKGMVTLPDVGDTVLVLFPHGDPAQGIVLGGLYGAQTPANWDWGVEGAAVRRYTFLTPGGQRVRLDDAGKAIRLENSDGSYFELSPGGITIHGKTDLKIEAPGRNIMIKGERIDFERG
jgi:phage baseplate assembly protein V